MSAVTIETIEQTNFGCPVTFEGRLSDDCVFYFRARWGIAALAIATDRETAIDVEMGTKLGFYREADDLTFGWIDAESARALIDGWVHEYTGQQSA